MKDISNIVVKQLPLIDYAKKNNFSFLIDVVSYACDFFLFFSQVKSISLWTLKKTNGTKTRVFLKADGSEFLKSKKIKKMFIKKLIKFLFINFLFVLE
jgi:hypothetical protein